MVMDAQIAFNIFIGAGGAVLGWVINEIWREIRSLQTADKDIVNRISAVEVLVAGNYVTRTELTGVTERIIQMLQTIDKKLDKKQDK